MASSIDGVFPTSLQEKILESKVLVVGAGGIGCEILKNLVMSGFPDIEIIDLDSIDLSNLNRQFLFHKEHVGKSKAEVARESALKFNPTVKIKAYHDSIFNTEYGVDYFEKFNIVLNALDNRQARNHVNRMCLNAGVPLIESGTAGYNGQVELIQKGLTQCYECTPKATQKTFPGCTIRNTPSEPIHCIVWAKHLFNQLFGETVDDEDISPDYADPEAGGDSNADEGNVKRVNTRLWAEESDYDAETLFNKFFYDDINYLLSMSNLWKTRKPPVPIKWDSILLDENKSDDEKEFLRQYHKIWTFSECAAVFADSLDKLKAHLAEMPANEKMIWDKDDNPAMDFVSACANIRAYIFEIGMKSRFEIKSMAGNIIPAIATTNAITAGIVVMHAFNALQGQFDKCKSVYIRHRPNPRNQLLVPEKLLNPPNPKCYVCAPDPAIHLKVDTNKVRICDLRDEILIRGLNMVNPDVIIDAKSVIVISSEEGETEANDEKTMSEMAIVSGTLLKVDDFFQNYNLSIIVIHMDAERDGPLFEIIADKDKLKPQEEPAATSEATNGAKKAEEDLSDGPSTSKKSRVEVVDEDDDLCLIEDDDDVVVGEKADAVATSANDADGTEASNATSNSSSSEKTENTSIQPKATANSSSSAATKRKPPSADDDDDDDENSEDGPTTTKRNKPDEDEDEDDDDGDVVTIID